MRAILDTNLIIATDVPPLADELAVSIVTFAELNFSVLVAREPAVRAERLRRLGVLQRQFDPLPVDEAVAASYGQLAAAVVEAGRQPRARTLGRQPRARTPGRQPRARTLDLLIAATAHAHSARLYTRNLGDFVGLTDLVDVVAI